MNNYLNFLIEANVGLCFFIVLYVVLLSRETDFRFKRITLIAGVLMSLIFPLIHLNDPTTLVPSISTIVPAYWLPEVVVGNASAVPEAASFNVWSVLSIIYGIGVVVFLAVFLVRLFSMMRLIQRSDTYRDGKFIIAESETTPLPTFSFFNFIFISRKDLISEAEKQQIIAHEKVHGTRLHSFDILLLNILQIFFWFNPLLGVYKKIFIQLHEFEADARAVENRDVNDYCNLLARVALLSADFKLANHFNHSLTLKRITMMRTIKRKIRPWKMAAFFALVPVIFVAIACQDQIAEDLDSIAKNSVATTGAPDHVQKRLEQLKAENPAVNYILLQMNDEATATIKKLEAKYGLPKSMEVFTGDQEPIKGASDAGVKMEVQKPDNTTFVILAYDELKQHDSFVTADGDVFTVVEKMPQYVGGQEALGAYLGENIKYPKTALDAGIQGTVFTQFIVNADGKISDVSILKGVSDDLNNEALRVVESMPAWTPGEQQGKRVKVKYVMPIKFAD